MFEKSLYDLIRGLRNHKGTEKEYIQNSLKECRNEIRQADMDIKTTALLKLIYLEMFGHDMSWASFHVLEVMSSAKYLQKRVGYLGAEQSFRPDTDVLMLATNLLKKDLTSTSMNQMSLPIATLPHIITSSLAMSVLSDLLPRLNHSNPAIRKKTIVTLYRLALVYPETLRPSWPKIKERLMDENEDSSVTAAIVNVVCELGWRRPQDFLPMAPRLFDLLVDSGNNWMAIKLIKLFATLTPLEPRLVRKLLPPLTSIIRTTPAMSLLYECIDGIIQGGILDSGEGEEIASLCVNKLRGMIMVEGDANLKYVALLAFGKIVKTHPYLVAQQEDVILDCLDSADITIRMRALDLVVGMVSSENLVSIVSRLMRQLRTAPRPSLEKAKHLSGVEPAAESDDERPEVNIKASQSEQAQSPPLPDDYRIDVINKILEMCSSNNYAYLTDFDWYIDVLVQLVRNSPAPNPALSATDASDAVSSAAFDVSENIGNELRNVAVKVRAIRPSATRAAEGILTASYNEILSQSGAGRGALKPTAWIASEYAAYLTSPDDVLTALLQLSKPHTSSESLAVYLQSIPKILALIAGDDQAGWSPARKTMMTLLMSRVIHALEPLAIHPDLEVQERAVEFLELLKLTTEATSAQEASSETYADAPLLLTQALPSLFQGLELNSIAPGAQRNVPPPRGLDLDQPINIRLNELLAQADSFDYSETDQDEFGVYYHQKPSAPVISLSEPAANRLDEKQEFASSYQQSGEDSYLDPDIIARRKAERMERYKDDPFYIGEGSGTSTPLHNIISGNNETDLDIDSIPIMQLDVGKTTPPIPNQRPKPSSVPRQRIQIAADETLPGSGSITPRNEDSEGDGRPKAGKVKSLLQVDSSSLGAFSFEESSEQKNAYDYEAQRREEAEMAQAMKEVERLRLEMQRANERIQAAQGVEGTVVKKKKKKKTVPAAVTATPSEGDGSLGGEPVKVKKKKTKPKALSNAVESSALEDTNLSITATTVKPKKRKKKPLESAAPVDEGEGTLDA